MTPERPDKVIVSFCTKRTSEFGSIVNPYLYSPGDGFDVGVNEGVAEHHCEPASTTTKVVSAVRTRNLFINHLLQAI